MSIKFTDVKPMIERKILRNMLTIELIKTHKELFHKEVEIRQAYMDSCDTKIYLLETMNMIENIQLNEYDKSREISVADTSKEIEKMDKEMVIRISKIYKNVQQKKELSKELISQIDAINDTIPVEGVATNYQVNFKDSIGGRCIP
jgi:RecJ-like exonuclease